MPIPTQYIKVLPVWYKLERHQEDPVPYYLVEERPESVIMEPVGGWGATVYDKDANWYVCRPSADEARQAIIELLNRENDALMEHYEKNLELIHGHGHKLAE